tara:strand:+ start:757 stop:1158 length:402 start_codon:yes stop_codon:yes gene_type:complete
VSKSLKQMAYDTIEAHQETIADLRNQLAKANERVRECHKELVNRHDQIQELRQENGEYAILIANLVRRADVKTDLLQNPKFEKASVQLNKFAIEKSIEGVQRVLDCGELNLSQGDIDTIRLIREQLRKEQSND